jgi:creatinine amidohydrolase
MLLEEAAWPEVKRLAPETVVVVPFAAIEQHGPHLPIGTDTFITDGLVRRLDRRLGSELLALPVQRFGSSSHHLRFPGTTTLSARTFLDAAIELVLSMAAHGFRRFLLLNGHGGNQSLLNVAVQELRERRPELTAVHATYWAIASEGFAAIRESPDGGMGHACEMETSVILALRGDLVHRDRLEAGGEPPRSRFDHRDMLRPAPVGQFRYTEEWTESGVIGDPTTASAQKGERFMEAAVEAVAELVQALRAGKIG